MQHRSTCYDHSYPDYNANDLWPYHMPTSYGTEDKPLFVEVHGIYWRLLREVLLLVANHDSCDKYHPLPNHHSSDNNPKPNNNHSQTHNGSSHLYQLPLPNRYVSQKCKQAV